MAEDTIKDEEYAPITQALRGWLTVAALMQGHELSTPLAKGVLAECDNIDAIHKALEEQNAKLHEKVLNQRKQLADVQEAIERRNNGVLKRRWQKKMDALKNENEEMRNFNSRVREAIRRHEDLTLWGTDYMALPLDADGVPIHVGDEMDTSSFGTVEVEGFVHSAIAFYNYEDQPARLCTSPAKLCHHHKPTVADVLREFADGIKNQNADFTELAIERYAKLLQLVDGDAE